MDLFKLEPGLFIWTWITFGTLLLVLYKLVFPSLLAGIKAREDKIAASVDKAEEIEKRLADIEAEHRQVIAEAQKKADAILLQVRDEAGELKKKLADKASREASDILEEARRKIEEERLAMLEAMRKDIAEFVCDTAGKLVGRSFTGEAEREWTEKLVDKL